MAWVELFDQRVHSTVMRRRQPATPTGIRHHRSRHGGRVRRRDRSPAREVPPRALTDRAVDPLGLFEISDSADREHAEVIAHLPYGTARGGGSCAVISTEVIGPESVFAFSKRLQPSRRKISCPDRPRRDELNDMSDNHSEWSALARTAEITAAANQAGRWDSLRQNAIGTAWAHEADQLHVHTSGSALRAIVADLRR